MIVVVVRHIFNVKTTNTFYIFCSNGGLVIKYIFAFFHKVRRKTGLVATIQLQYRNDGADGHDG